MQEHLKTSGLAAAQDNRNDRNKIGEIMKDFEINEKPSDKLSFSTMPHELVWSTQEGSYDNIMKNSYFSLSDKAISMSKKENAFATPGDMLKDMKEIAGERNVAHYMNYPSSDGEGTISNLMIKERNFQRYMENPSHIREMIADAFLLKIANDGAISESDRDRLLEEAQGGMQSSELHDLMARMTYLNPEAYQAFHKILVDSEKLYSKAKSDNGQKTLEAAYDKFYKNNVSNVINALHGKNEGDSSHGADMKNVEESLMLMNRVSELLSDGENHVQIDRLDDIVNIKNLINPQKEADFSIEIEEFRKQALDLQDKGFSMREGRSNLEKTMSAIEDVGMFTQAHNTNQKVSNDVVYEMHQMGRYDQNPYQFLSIPEVGEEKDDGTLYDENEVKEELLYNKKLIQASVEKILVDEDKNKVSDMVDSIVYDLYDKEGAYHKSISQFLSDTNNDPMTMTVFSDLNSVASNIVRDAIYNELMDSSLQAESNSLFKNIKGNDKTVSIVDKLDNGEYQETIESHKDCKEDIAALMNKAVLFSKVSKGELNSDEVRNLVDKTSIFSDMAEDEKEALKSVTDEIYDAKDEIDASQYYAIDQGSKTRFLDDSVTDKVFGYIEKSDDNMMPGVSRFFRNNKAFSNFSRCGQSGSLKDRNAESISNNLKSCMENYRKDLESGREKIEDQTVRVLNSPFGAMNGLFVALVIFRSIFTEHEYSRSKRGLNDMHNDILNDLAFRRSSVDLKTEKARSAILSADANLGVTSTNVAHAVADKYKDSLMEEKLASTIFKAALNGRNLFATKRLDPMDIDFDKERLTNYNDAISELEHDKNTLKARLSTLKEHARIIKLASNIDEEGLNAQAEKSLEEFKTVETLLSSNITKEHRSVLTDKKLEIEKSMSFYQEENEKLKAAIKVQSTGKNILADVNALEGELNTIMSKLDEFGKKEAFANNFDSDSFRDVENDTLDVLIAKSNFLGDEAKRISLKDVDVLSKKDQKLLEQLTNSREIISVLITKKAAQKGLVSDLNKTFDNHFGFNRENMDTKMSGLDRAQVVLGKEKHVAAMLDIEIKNVPEGFSNADYYSLAKNIDGEQNIDKLELLHKQEDEYFKKLFLEVDKGDNLTSSGEKDLDSIRNLIESRLLSRELSINALHYKSIIQKDLVKLESSDDTVEQSQIAGSLKQYSDDFQKSQIATIANAKSKISQLDVGINYENDKDLLRFNDKSDLMQEAKSTGLSRSVKDAVDTLKLLSSVNDMKVGTTQKSTEISNVLKDFYNISEDKYKKEINNASGATVREFINRTEDNTSSMMLMTNERLVALEKARLEMIEKGEYGKVEEIDDKMKHFATDSLLFSTEGLQSWGENAKDAKELLANSVNAQESQKHIRSSMLRQV